MNSVFKLIIASFIIVGCSSNGVALTAIDIENDANDCVNGWISMDVTVTVDNEDFDFRPSCKFSFDDDFTTSSGLECEVSAGMCSAFSPKNRFEVYCEDGTRSDIDIECP